MEQQTICILLSTYNGESYLQDFLESLLQQTYSNFHLYVRDDGSSDNTIELIKKFKEAHHQISLIESNQNVGACMSFCLLLQNALQEIHNQYFMFADQDDVWLPEKLELSINKMQSRENKTNKPLLIHTDLKVVDIALKEISPSFWKFQNLDPNKDSLNRLLVQNVVTGCTIMINRPLAEKGVPIHKDAIMHDWWISLVASAFGEIVPLHQKTVLYRQHYDNNVGAKKFDLKYVVKKAFEKEYTLKPNFSQAENFLNSYDSNLNQVQKEVITEFIKLERTSYLKRVFVVLKHKFFKIGFLRNIGYILKL